MIVLDNRIANLVKGYDRIREAEEGLPARWRGRLLAGYTQRRAAYEAARARHWAHFRARLPTLLLGLALAILLGAGGLFLAEGLPATALVLAGLLGVLGVGGYGLWATILTAPKRPGHPLRGALRRRLFPRLLASWREGLEGRLPAKKAYEGAEGEYQLVDSLSRLRLPGSYLLYRLQQRPGDDLDVTVVGPMGVWTFEVKYWSGTVGWHDGVWEREKSFYGRGGRQVTEARPIGEAPDKQWQRMADDVAETLRRRDPWLAAEMPAVLQIRGGLALTHREATYEIASDCPFEWGTIEDWARRLGRAWAVPGLGEREVLRVLDALLARHRQVGNGGEILSMEGYAAQVIGRAERELEGYVVGSDGRTSKKR